jgi:hypothetical protein
LAVPESVGPGEPRRFNEERRCVFIALWRRRGSAIDTLASGIGRVDVFGGSIGEYFAAASRLSRGLFRKFIPPAALPARTTASTASTPRPNEQISPPRADHYRNEINLKLSRKIYIMGVSGGHAARCTPEKIFQFFSKNSVQISKSVL